MKTFFSHSKFLHVKKFPGQKPSPLPPVVNGRFASASPEHSLCRAGGGDRSGAGGSGTASWVSPKFNTIINCIPRIIYHLNKTKSQFFNFCRVWVKEVN